MMMRGFTIFVIALQLSVQIFAERRSSGDRWGTLSRSKRETPVRDCTRELQECLAELLEKVYDYKGTERSAALSRLGAQKFCEDALPASSCILRKIREEGCEDTDGYEAEAEGYNYMCIEKYEDVQKYWSCVSSFDVFGTSFKCWYKTRSANGNCMNKEQLTECINENFYLVQHDACEAAAFRFLHAIVEKAFSFEKQC